ncbi:hypothetical protein MASR2M78_25860 [Treponema sp.]
MSRQKKSRIEEVLANFNTVDLEKVSEELSPMEIKVLLYELRVHQIELQMQNDELNRIRYDLDSAKEKYYDLYDQAPVGYCTVDGNGYIKECNHTLCTMLGLQRNALDNQPLPLWIYKEDADASYNFLNKIRKDGSAQTCELRLKRDDESLFWVQLQAVPSTNELYRIALSKISDLKNAEKK